MNLYLKKEKNDLKLSAELYDKRLLDYENNLIKGFNSASKEVEELFRDRYRTLPVCSNIQRDVNECYIINASAPLKCIDLVQEFVKCVEREREFKLGLPPTNLNATTKINGA